MSKVSLAWAMLQRSAGSKTALVSVTFKLKVFCGPPEFQV
jgi:hypothetical protein